MIFKSYLLEQNNLVIYNYKAFLFYGENQGLKKEFKEKIKLDKKDLEKLNLFQDEILKNQNILINEIKNKSLFEKEKVVFINEANDKIVPIIENIVEQIEGEKIFIFSDVLDKKSKLRNLFEKSKIYGASPCYKDNEITLRNIIADKLKNYEGMSPQIGNLLIQNTNLDRNKILNEINKIQSYFVDKAIAIDKINQLLNIKSSDDFNELKDEALKGNKIKTNRLLADTIFNSENNIFYLNSINQRINRLNEIENLKLQNQNMETLIANLKPPVFWKDKSTLIDQAKKWNKKKIKQALNKTFRVEISIKSNSSINKDILIKNLIVELCQTANAS